MVPDAVPQFVVPTDQINSITKSLITTVCGLKIIFIKIIKPFNNNSNQLVLTK